MQYTIDSFVRFSPCFFVNGCPCFASVSICVLERTHKLAPIKVKITVPSFVVRRWPFLLNTPLYLRPSGNAVYSSQLSGLGAAE